MSSSPDSRMRNAYICDAVRTPIGRYAGSLATVRADDLGAIPMRALLERNSKLDAAAIEDVYYGCANQAGEDNRNVARMSSLLAGLPSTVPGNTINRLCGSGMDAVGSAARAIKAGEVDLAVAGFPASSKLYRSGDLYQKSAHAPVFDRNGEVTAVVTAEGNADFFDAMNQ